MCTDTSLYPAVPVSVTAPLADLRCRSGVSEVDGSDPPFLPPGSALRGRLMLTGVPLAWEGRSRPKNPCGKAQRKVALPPKMSPV